MSDPIISTSRLTRRFGPRTAVDHLALTVQRGEIYGLLGHNGAGKTTTVRLLNGLLVPDEGHMQVLGLDPGTQGDALRRQVGVLTETPGLEERLTARENLEFHGELHALHPARVRSRTAELLDTLDLAHAADKRVSTFSKGMKQRLAIARALLHDPQVLYLDEPTSGLDPVSARAVNATITHLARKEGRTVVLCTHDLADAQTLCDRVSILQQGRVIAAGTVTELSGQLGLHARVTLEVRPEQATRTAELIRAEYGATAVTDGVFVHVEQFPREDVPRLLGALVAANVSVYGVTRAAPTLEDVYFHLHGRAGTEVNA